MDMTAKEFLVQYQTAKQRIRYTQERLDRLRSDLLPGGISYDGMPGGGNPRTTADIMAQIDEVERKYNAQINQAFEIMAEVTDVIEQVEDAPCKGVLFARYISGKSWNRIADDEGYSWRHIMRLHGRGLGEVSSILRKMS